MDGSRRNAIFGRCRSLHGTRTEQRLIAPSQCPPPFRPFRPLVPLCGPLGPLGPRAPNVSDIVTSTTARFRTAQPLSAASARRRVVPPAARRNFCCLNFARVPGGAIRAAREIVSVSFRVARAFRYLLTVRAAFCCSAALPSSWRRRLCARLSCAATPARSAGSQSRYATIYDARRVRDRPFDSLDSCSAAGPGPAMGPPASRLPSPAPLTEIPHLQCRRVYYFSRRVRPPHSLPDASDEGATRADLLAREISKRCAIRRPFSARIAEVTQRESQGRRSHGAGIINRAELWACLPKYSLLFSFAGPLALCAPVGLGRPRRASPRTGLVGVYCIRRGLRVAGSARSARGSKVECLRPVKTKSGAERNKGPVLAPRNRARTVPSRG